MEHGIVLTRIRLNDGHLILCSMGKPPLLPLRSPTHGRYIVHLRPGYANQWGFDICKQKLTSNGCTVLKHKLKHYLFPNKCHFFDKLLEIQR